MKLIRYMLLCNLILLISCNDADYKTLDNSAFINESRTASSAKVIITDDGATTEITPCLTQEAPHDCKLKIVVDTALLNKYNEQQGTSYVPLPEGAFTMPSEVVIPKGEYSIAPVKINIKPLTQAMIGESYAIPVRLVSEDSDIPAMTKTGSFVITTEAIVTSALPQFTGAAMLEAKMPKGDETYNEYTIEVKFQVSNTGNRDRAVFLNNGSGEPNFVLLRFEDPQSNNASHKAHSLVQIVGRNRIYMNPTFSFVPNKWQHLALTCDGSHYRLYINGAFAGVKDIPAGATTFKQFKWFTKGDDPFSRWGGCKILMTEARVWSVCRTETQIQKNQSTVSPKAKGLEAYWRFNEGTGNVFQDATGKGHTLTTTETPVWVQGIKSTDEHTDWK